jgi:hypothetical protein
VRRAARIAVAVALVLVAIVGVVLLALSVFFDVGGGERGP